MTKRQYFISLCCDCPLYVYKSPMHYTFYSGQVKVKCKTNDCKWWSMTGNKYQFIIIISSRSIQFCFVYFFSYLFVVFTFLVLLNFVKTHNF